MSKKALIIGVSGQDGAYLCELLLGKGYEIHGTSRDHVAATFDNLQSIGVRERVITHSLDLNQAEEIRRLFNSIRPDEIYNLAGQSSVGISFQRPLETFQSIAGVTLSILEAMRLDQSRAKFFNAGSGEIFGETPVPANEEMPVNPKSPYGVAKAAAFHLVKNYRTSYGLFASIGILFNHESPLRPERFVTQKIVKAAVRIANGSKERLKLGNLEIYRDWGWAPEYVDAMWRILQHEEPEDFVISTGVKHSLKEFLEKTFGIVGLNAWDHVDTDPMLLRPSDIKESVGNSEKASRLLGWNADTAIEKIIANLTCIQTESNQVKK
jgi:GDPmannose 4,6-dehydratase